MPHPSHAPCSSVLLALGFLPRPLSLPLSPSLSFQVNFFSYVALATAALPTLEKNHGSVVVVSSLTGQCVTEVQLLHTSALSQHTSEL